MGVPLYFKTILEQYNNVLLSQNNYIKKSNLFFDLNCLIHPCCRDETNEDLMFIKIKDYIDKIINLVNPEFTYIAIDGVCPRAKMQQQRKRRYKSSKENKIWDTNTISPGTEFMNKLNIFLKKTYTSKDIVISDSDERGEGEQKIFDYIKKHNLQNNIIYGLDADLIILSLLCDNKTYLLRERTEYNIEELESEFIYLDINILKKYVISNIKYNNVLSDKEVIQNYCILFFILGNDFVPHSPSINIRYNGVDELLSIYNELIEETNGIFLLYSENTINIKFLKMVFYKLSRNEDKRIKNILEIRNKQENKFKNIYNNEKDKNKVITHKPIVFRKKENEIFKDIDNWNNNYYMYELYHEKYYPVYKKILDEKINDMCNEYFKSIIWCAKYYIDKCYSWKWYYKYSVAPSFNDLNKYVYLDYLKEELESYESYEQLMIILPPKSYNLLDNKYKKILEKKYYYLSPHNFKESHILKRYLWESEPIIPDFNEF
jgi:5'-3' exonuclease